MKKCSRPFFLFFATLVLLTAFFSCEGSGIKNPDAVHLIPVPQEMVPGRGSFCLTSATPVYTNLEGEERRKILDFIQQSPLQLSIEGEKNSPKALQLICMPDVCANPEAYQLQVRSSGITIEAASGAGIFYGLQSLLQLMQQYGVENIPAVTIRDTPYLSHRGFMLDVSRHFFPKEFIKKQLDLMAYYKMNRFHWHLVDATGWRIEIKKYPELTEKAAWRPEENLIEWAENGSLYCSKETPGAYGGYYTQEEIREVVEYAAQRYITVIPEIEMPGHSREVFAAFPELACSGKPYVNADFCIGNPHTYIFLEDVLAEVMDLFPSGFIHIGGDEAGKRGWKTCPACQKLMRKEGMQHIDELQSYLIHHMDEFLAANNRRLLGWDEIMEGGLAPNATVMSWQGEVQGIEAVQRGHEAIMSPIDYCYFNFYQDAPVSHVLSWAGYTPLEKVYAYNPVPDSLSPEESKRILGVQANLWTEYIPTEDQAEMMIWPRLLAIAETGWSFPEKKSYIRFRENALHAVDFLSSAGYHPFDLRNEVGERREYDEKVEHLALGKTVAYQQPYSIQYPAGGASALTDGLQGGWTYVDQRWQGFTGNSMDIVIDLEQIQTVRSIGATFMQDGFGWYWLPKEVEIYTSTDHETFDLLVTIYTDIPFSAVGFFLKNFGWTGETEARYIRYVAHPDPENELVGFLFVDEVIVK